MPSRAETRGRIELALRTVSIALIAWMLWLSLDRGERSTSASSGSVGLNESLRAWSVAGDPPDQIKLALTSVPSPRQRDWIAALAGAGSNVSWTGDLPAVGVAAIPVASPRGGINVLSAGPEGSSIVLADGLGPIDTTEARAGGASFTIPAASEFLSASTAGTSAFAPVPERPGIRRLLVLGRAGWESKFVVTALEEDGWGVDASIYVAPGVNVTQGTVLPIDTARYSAVIAVDASAASRAAAIVQFVSRGGGLVILGGAATITGFEQLRAGAAGRVTSPAPASDTGVTTLASIPVAPIAAMKTDAVALDVQRGMTVSAARRHVAGRVLQLGYVDTWRWRLSGGDDSMDDHRDWLTRAVSTVASATPADAAPTDTLDSAPVAGLIASLGPPGEVQGPRLASSVASLPPWLIFGILVVTLLGEWASRRFRGLK